MRRLLRYSLGLASAALPVFAHAQCEPAWLYGPDQSFPGVNVGVRAMAIHDDGAGPALYAGGNFTIAGDQRASGIGRWDGAAWQPLADGLNGTVLCLASHNGRLVAGGLFSSPADPTIRNIAAWDGAAWRPLAEGLPYDVTGLAEYHGELYAGVTRLSSGPNDGFVARWDGVRWQRLAGPYGPAVRINALAVFHDELYIGGSFDRSTGNTSRNLARWNGSQWMPLPGEPGSPVDALCVYRDKLILATHSSKVGGLPIREVAAWDGSSWSTLAGGLGGLVEALAVFQDRLIVSGVVKPPGSSDSRFLLTWDGSAWRDLPHTLVVYPLAMAEFQDHLFVGATALAPSDGTFGAGITRWDGLAWSGLTAGFDREILQLHAGDDAVYARGRFTRAGSSVRTTPNQAVARWNGDEWEWLDVGGQTMTTHQGSVIVANGVAFLTYEVLKFDGSTPARLGGLFNNQVGLLHSSGGDLIASGEFTEVGGVPATRVARWDGVAWRSMGSFTSPATAFTEFRGEIIAAGQNWVRRWNGSTWAVINGAPNGRITDLTVYGDRLIAAGHFQKVGITTIANSMASWNGTSWSKMGTGILQDDSLGDVWALAVVNGDLVAAGEFDSAGGEPAANIARWDGSSWHAMGDGTNGRVHTLAVYNNELILGGAFTIVDGRVSAYWARWGCQPSVFEDPSLDPVMEILKPRLIEDGRR